METVAEMCGIAGVMALGDGPAADPAVLARMTATLAHRGPDAEGRFVADGVGLGVRRLSIIDVDHGDQPMYSEDGNAVLVCNGEIFNHRELRADLAARGHRFRTACDVEVLVHLYEEEGTGLLHRVNGQFAFAIYDRRERRLFLARDHLGVLPLHYATTRDQIVFGSEAKAVLNHPAVAREVDLVGLDQVLTFPGLVSPRTMFRDIHSLPGGHYLLVRDGTAREFRYWDLDYPLDGSSPQEPDEYYVETLRDLLAEAVRRRLDADVPVGFYLSGGLDSSLIGALMARMAPSDALSITFPDAAIDESGYQRLAARHIAARHHEERVAVPDLIEGLHQMVRHAECPVKETYNTCSLALSALARRNGIKVVLSGEGADELFGGYLGYRFDRLGQSRSRLRGGLGDALEAELRASLWGDPDLFYERRYHEWRAAKLDLYSEGVRAMFDDVDCLRHPLVDHSRLAAAQGPPALLPRRQAPAVGSPAR
ncbi:asparagine synthase (glutamine-hydrolyzing) [Actinoallomurus acanthiterrae]